MNPIIIEPMRRHVEWWTDHVARRMSAAEPSRQPFERDKFLQRIADRPGAEDLAAKFETAVAEAHGNPARFRRELERLLG
jgi:hypothetical protein